MKKHNKLIILTLLTAILAAIVSGCQNTDADETVSNKVVVYTSFRDIPGVTAREIAEVEAIRGKFDYFNYGMMLSTETFYNKDGKIGGYTAHICDWLTELFGIPFVPSIVTWEQISEGLRNGDIDFTGTLTTTEERRLTYYMTDPIAQRTTRAFRLVGSEPVEEITQTRLPKYALLRGAVYAENVLTYAFDDFEAVYISEYVEAYELMKNGTVDALLAESSAEAVFDTFEDVVSVDYFPLLYAPVSLTAYNYELEPIIRIVQMALDNEGIHHLNAIYEIGHKEYQKHKLYNQLTDEEHAYIRNNPVIPYAAEFENYPVSFFDRYGEEHWQGISFDVLHEIETLTGLTFEVVNDEHTDFYILMQMLEDGEVYMMSELIRTREREGRFLWPENYFSSEWSVLISRANYPNINVNRVYTHSAGLVRGNAHAEFFLRWFPHHKVKIYDNQQDVIDALIAGDVDLIIASNSFYLYLTNYLELPDYKANVIFDNEFTSTFGINKNQELLHSIVDKAMSHIDTRTIAEQWQHRTYEFRIALALAEADAQRPWLFGTTALLVCVFILLVVLISRKQSEKQRLDSLVKKRTTEVEAANRAKSAFLSVMSHEIRTPMNAIIGIAEIQLQRSKLDIDTRTALERIYMSGDLLLGIINDILDLSKIEAGKLELLMDRYEVASVVSDTAQLNMMRVGSKRILFELDVDENTPVLLYGDELRVKQIMNNLLSNAFKYTSEGTIKLTVKAVQDKKKDDEIILTASVSDTGIGMTKEQLKKIFDEYTRFNQAADRSTEGTGLGMSITKNLLRLMGGEITVESEQGKGSTFTVRLPQRKVNDAVLGKEMVENLSQFRTSNFSQMKRVQISRDPMPYGEVLLVDDVDTNIYVAKGLLSPYELQIDSATSGTAAIEKIKNGRVYDIIFMDHMMPKPDGIETTKRIREMGYDQPIVALTANAVAGQAGLFFENGFNDFVSKPIDLRQLNMVLNKWIRDKQPQDVIDAARHAAALKREHSVAGQQEEEHDNTSVLYRNIVGLDIIKGFEQANGDMSAYIQILRSYADSLRKSIEAVESTMASDMSSPTDEGKEKLHQYNRTVHSIKGTSYYVFAEQLSHQAEWLERASAEGDFEYMAEHTPALLDVMRKLIADLDELLSDYDLENPRPVKHKPDKELLLKALNACKRFDVGELDDAMEEIELYKYDSDDGLVNWLREAVNKMDMTQIVEKLSEMDL